jgi:hypothetical protein
MPRHSLKSVRKTFDESLESALLLFQVAERFSSKDATQEGSEPAIRPGQARRITGLAFLVMVKAWEELVEACLVAPCRFVWNATLSSGRRQGHRAGRQMLEL